MFSKACEYGIRALTVIAKASDEDRKLGIKEICEKAQTPISFTAKILQTLVKKGLIRSQKGPSGGFYIDNQLAQVSLYDVVEAIDGSAVFEKCGLGLKACDASRPCPLHDEFEVVRDQLEQMCKSNDLQTLTSNLILQNYIR